MMFTIANLDAVTQAIPDKDRSSIINQAFGSLRKNHFQYEGTIAKYWQHTLLAFLAASPMKMILEGSPCCKCHPG